MTTPFAALALSPQEGLGWVTKGLAVLGGALVGALLVGFLMRSLYRSMTSRQAPPFAVSLFRLVGAALGGFLVYLALFGPGGLGWGGGPGSGDGNGDGDPSKDKQTNRDGPPDRDAVVKDGKDSRVQPSNGERVEVAVLGKSRPAKDRWYRFEKDTDRKGYTLDEVKKELLRRKELTPGLKVDLVGYQDSPADGTEPYRVFRRWLIDADLFGRELGYDRNAPK